MIVRALTTRLILRPRNCTSAVGLANFPAKRLLHCSEKVKVVKMADEDIAVTTFRNYLRIDTEQPNPNYKACEEFLQSYAKELQIKCTTVECVPGKPVVIMTIEGQNLSLPSLFLYSHTDVVPTFKEHWKYDPYSAHKDEHGNIYARGTQDMKCVGIQYMEALRRLKKLGECNFLRTIHIVWGPDEEISGSDGMKIFVQHPKFKELNIGFALDEGIASEDETYKVFCGERCIWWLKVICKGSPGHGSKFIKNTAGAKLQSIINSLLAYRDEQERLLNSDPKLNIGDVTTVNLTKVEGGVQLNVIPAELIAYFDIRIPPTADFDKLEAQIGEWCKQAGSDVSHEFLQYYKITTMTSSSKDDPWWNAFSSVLDELHLKYKTEIFVGATDSRYLRELNYKAIGFSPMINTPQLLHDHNEFLNENVFLRGVDIYAKLIPRLANLPDH